MYVRLGYVKFAIPMRVSGHELSTIDLLKQDGADKKIVSAVGLMDNGWVEIVPADFSRPVYASPDCCRQAMALEAPSHPMPTAPSPVIEANSSKRKK